MKLQVERNSGQNENDILNLAHEIFFNNHKKNSTLNMLVRNFEMIRSGASLILVKPMEVQKGGSLMTVQILQPLTRLTTILVELIKQPLGPWVLRHLRGMVSKRLRQRRSRRLSFIACGASRRRIWPWRRGCRRWSCWIVLLQNQNRCMSMKKRWRRSLFMTCCLKLWCF